VNQDMKFANSLILKAMLAGIIGLATGLVITAVVNLVSPAGNLIRTLVVACVAAFLSAFFGYLLGARHGRLASAKGAQHGS
jgi:hypothetical protein